MTQYVAGQSFLVNILALLQNSNQLLIGVLALGLGIYVWRMLCALWLWCRLVHYAGVFWRWATLHYLISWTLRYLTTLTILLLASYLLVILSIDSTAVTAVGMPNK